MPEAASSREWDGRPVDDLAARLAGTRFADVRAFSEIDSTNRYLLAEARAGAPEGAVAVADHQSAGRGRMGRSWTAPAGASLLVSVLVRPRLPAAHLHVVTMAAGVSACEAVWTAAGFTPSLKWPNDLVVGDRKLAGMLSEADLGGGAAPGSVGAVVVGIGLNVNWDEFPPELADLAVACNQVAGEPVDRTEVLVRFLERFDARYDALAAPGGREAVAGEYRQRCATLGRHVRIEQGGETWEGTALDVDDDGRLLVDTGAGERRAVAVGDVAHVRPA